MRFTKSSQQWSFKDFMKQFCECLQKHALRMINFWKKKKKLLTNEKQQSYKTAKICHICGKTFEDKFADDKNYCKIGDHCYCTGKYRGAAHSICNLKYIMPKEITVIFHNGSNYDYYLL